MCGYSSGSLFVSHPHQKTRVGRIHHRAGQDLLWLAGSGALGADTKGQAADRSTAQPNAKQDKISGRSFRVLQEKNVGQVEREKLLEFSLLCSPIRPSGTKEASSSVPSCQLASSMPPSFILRDDNLFNDLFCWLPGAAEKNDAPVMAFRRF